MPFSGGAFESLLLFGSRGPNRFGALLCEDMALVGTVIERAYKEFEERDGFVENAIIMSDSETMVGRLEVTARRMKGGRFSKPW